MLRGPRRSLLLVVLVVLLCGFLGALFGQRVGSASQANDTDIRESLRTFSQVYDLVEQNYAEPVNADKAIYNGAIPGMLRVLDPHSNFFDPKSYCSCARSRSENITALACRSVRATTRSS